MSFERSFLNTLEHKSALPETHAHDRGAHVGTVTCQNLDVVPEAIEDAISHEKEKHAGAWTAFQSLLKKEFGKNVYETWIKPIQFKSYDQHRLVLGVPTTFMRDWIDTHYGMRLRMFLGQHLKGFKSLSLLVSEGLHLADLPAITSSSFASSSPPINTSFPTPHAENSPAEENWGAALDPRFTFENFVVGRPNELAYAAALRVSEETSVTFNPLFLYGGVGLGKTHLMHAIAWKIKELHPKRRVIYLSAEKFMYQFIRALRHKDTMAFKEQFRSVDVLMIDDVQFICGKESTQEEFFHTFNALVDQNHQIIVSADKSPSDLNGIEERMRSRLGWGLVADIHPTTYELRLGILQAKAECLELKVPDRVLEFVAHKITSNVRELEGALTRIAAHSSFVGREISIEMVQDVLRDLLRANDRRITLEDIQKKVAERYGLKLSDFQSAARHRNIARPRQIAMYLGKMLTTKSYFEIGRSFGGRDHKTVVHAVKVIEELRQSDNEISHDIDFLRRMLES